MFCQRVHMSPVRALFLVIFLMGLIPPDLSAQYFGQNKVRYETFDFKVLRTPHFDIHYYEEEADVAQEAARMAERWYTRLSSMLGGHQLPPQQPLILYASHPAFRGTSVVSGAIGETTGGVTEGLRRRVVMPVAGPLAETDHVLGHELVHAFQFSITRRSGLPAALQLPLWFIEGMAEYLSVGSVDPLTAMWLRDAVRREELPTIAQLDDPDYFPYRFGQAFWAYIDGTYGSPAIGQLLSFAATGGVEDAIRGVLGVSIEDLSQQWHDALNEQYLPVLDMTSLAESYGPAIIPATERGGQLNVGPVLSPDGSQMIFFSERDLYSIDLYLADARTGEINRKITETAIDPHFDSLQFVNSAGAWSADGRRVAVGAISEGRPELTIYDVAGRRVERSFRFPQFGEILGVTWSPDSRFVALSAMSGGVTDLFVFELETENLRRLTDDAFADLQPVWSPDGTHLAFVTDRFTSNLETLSFGDYRLGLVDVATGATSAVAGFNEGKHVNPQWGSDSASLFFISDRDGISNIYRVALAGGDVRQITNVPTGVTGISALSPAFSVAANGNQLVFTSFAEGGYSIHRVETPEVLVGQPPSQAIARLNAAVLPPASAAQGDIARLLQNASEGLPQPQTFTTTDYEPDFSLDYIAPPEVSVGTGNFGSLIGGGTAFSWSDLLGNHNVTATIQTSFSTEGGHFLNNLSGIVGYTNQKSRWSWGITGGQVPFASGGFSRLFGDTEDGPVAVDESVRYWQINRELAGIFGYPFNRAQRLEFSVGYRNISFDAESETQIYSLNTGQLILDESENLPTPSALNIGTASAALVYDTSIFGGTSPILGQRYRFELGGTTGSLRYFSLLGDYRRYFQPIRPLTFATRLLHFGRYGGGSGDDRLQDIFIGNTSLVRGYGSDSFSADDCRPSLSEPEGCPAFDQLLGSRMAVANAELRLPIFGYLGIVPSPGVPPVELAAFYDAGVAWTSGDTANFFGGSRRPVTSYGGTVRVNILGFAIGQASYVHPNDRPGKDWKWEFNLSQGF